MKIKHILLEVYCDYKSNQDISCCFQGEQTIGIHCFKNKCKFLSYIHCPNELSYSGEDGTVSTTDDFIGFGGEMDAEAGIVDYDNKSKELLKRWEEICREKISEAYDEYMLFKKGEDD